MVAGSDLATAEAFEGVELRFGDGVARTCRPFTVAEAVHFLRLEALILGGDGRAARAFALEFAERIGVLDVELVDLGLSVEGPGAVPLVLGDLTVADGLGLAETVGVASGIDSAAAKAQAKILETFPKLFGLDQAVLSPADVFDVARSFVRELYMHIYGLAKDFSAHLSRRPREKVTMARAPGSVDSCATPASTI